MIYCLVLISSTCFLLSIHLWLFDWALHLAEDYHRMNCAQHRNYDYTSCCCVNLWGYLFLSQYCCGLIVRGWSCFICSNWDLHLAENYVIIRGWACFIRSGLSPCPLTHVSTCMYTHACMHAHIHMHNTLSLEHTHSCTHTFCQRLHGKWWQTSNQLNVLGGQRQSGEELGICGGSPGWGQQFWVWISRRWC